MGLFFEEQHLDMGTCYDCERPTPDDQLHEIPMEHGFERICFDCKMRRALTCHWEGLVECAHCHSSHHRENMIRTGGDYLCPRCEAGLFEARLEHGR